MNTQNFSAEDKQNKRLSAELGDNASSQPLTTDTGSTSSEPGTLPLQMAADASGKSGGVLIAMLDMCSYCFNSRYGMVMLIGRVWSHAQP